MSERVTMPALGESVTEGTVTRWLKQIGDQVAVDEPLLEVSTDKVDTEIPSPVAGTVQEILVGEDETVPVGADLAVIGEGAEGGGAGSQQDGGQGSEQQPEAQQDQPQQDQPQQDRASQQDQPAQESTQDPVEASAQATGMEQGPDDQQERPADEPAAQQDQPQQDQPPADSGSGDAGSGGTTVTMPALGESVTEGTVTRWLKAEGDTVEVDEPLLEVSTDKVDTEVPSPVAGTVQRILVGEDQTVPVGAELAVVGSGAAAPAAEPQPQQDQSAEQDEPQQEASQQDESGQQEPAAAEQPAAEPDEGAGAPTAPQPSQPAEPIQSAEPSQSAVPSQPAESSPAPQAEQPAAAPSAPAPASSGSSGDALGDAATYVTPLVRKLASEHGVDLAAVAGTGVGGRIRKQDVLDAAAAQRQAEEEARKAAEPAPQAPAAAPAASTRPSSVPESVAAKRGTTERMTRLRRVIAQRMVESLQTSAQLTTVVEVDVTKIARLRDRAKRDFQAREGVKLSFLPFFAQAVVEALKIHPMVNASIDGEEITYHGQENLGIAVDTERGLLVPVIKDAGDLNIAGLARKIADLAERTRTNKIGPDELGGGTFTLTNTGSRGALFDTPIINQPQVAILGTGAVVRRPVVVADPDGGETIAIRSMVYFALSYDHRLVDGADAARFLSTIKERLEDGSFESDLGL